MSGAAKVSAEPQAAPARPPADAHFSVAIMAKAPVAGYAKTRLIPLLGAAGAARVQRDFILRALRVAAAAAPRSISLWCAPGERQRFFRALRRSCNAAPGLVFERQAEGDIGQRMAQAFAAHAAGGTLAAARPRPEPLVLVGTDCPLLTPAHIRQAATALAAGADAVFLPVCDGGYVMVGLRDPAAGMLDAIFSGIDWSTDRVMAQTRDRLRAAGARWEELETLWDVDEPADWLRWERMGGR